MKESQVRVTEHLEVFYTQDDFTEECEALEGWKADVPEVAQGYVAHAGAEAQEVRSLLSDTLKTLSFLSRSSALRREQQGAFRAQAAPYTLIASSHTSWLNS